MKKSLPKEAQMEKGVTYIFLSLLLSLLIVSTLVILGPILSNKGTGIQISHFIVLVFGCISMVLGGAGIRYIKEAGFSWYTIILSTISFLASGAILFLGSRGLINSSPEVKGVVFSVGSDFITIQVDENYKSEYNTYGTPLLWSDGYSSVSLVLQRKVEGKKAG